MVIAIGSDHGGLKLKTDIVNHLKERGIEVLDKGCNSFDSCDYPDYAAAVTDAVVGKDADSRYPCMWYRYRYVYGG